MAKRDNHYEAAFEGFLRSKQVPYVAVDEAKRSLAAELSIKCVDFIVPTRGAGTWLVDVKGRRFPSGRQKQYWKNWSTRDDVRSLARWEDLFGERFHGLFVFAYNVMGDRSPLAADELYHFRGARYAFVAVPLWEYAAHARSISPRWDTVAMPAAEFRRLAAPLDYYLNAEFSPTAEPYESAPC